MCCGEAFRKKLKSTKDCKARSWSRRSRRRRRSRRSRRRRSKRRRRSNRRRRSKRRRRSRRRRIQNGRSDGRLLI
jgi:hypothetical protein